MIGILFLLVFHPAAVHADWIPCAERCGYGEWQRVSGAPEWLAARLRYDEVGVWEVEEGVPEAWTWTPLGDGDVISIDERGVVRVTKATN